MDLVWAMLSLDACGTPKGRSTPGQACSSQRGRLTSPSNLTLFPGTPGIFAVCGSLRVKKFISSVWVWVLFLERPKREKVD